MILPLPWAKPIDYLTIPRVQQRTSHHSICGEIKQAHGWGLIVNAIQRPHTKANEGSELLPYNCDAIHLFNLFKGSVQINFGYLPTLTKVKIKTKQGFGYRWLDSKSWGATAWWNPFSCKWISNREARISSLFVYDANMKSNHLS